MAEIHRSEIFEGLSRVLCSVQRQSGLVLRITVTFGLFGVFLLNMAAIGQDDSAQIKSRFGAIYGVFETAFDQFRNVSAVIQMSMSQKDRVKRARIERRRVPVPQAQYNQA